VLVWVVVVGVTHGLNGRSWRDVRQAYRRLSEEVIVWKLGPGFCRRQVKSLSLIIVVAS